MSQTDWDIAAVLYQDDRPITEVSLAHVVKYPRTTIRKYTQSGLEKGLLERSKNGLQLSCAGRKFISLVFSETHGIALGQTMGYSVELIEHFTVISKSNRTQQANNNDLIALQFFPKLPPNIFD